MSSRTRTDFVLWLIEIFPVVVAVSGSENWIIGGVRIEGVVPKFFNEVVLPPSSVRDNCRCENFRFRYVGV
jgi:hypothetical protein